MSKALEVLNQLPLVRRGWPGKAGSILVEAFDNQHRLRAGKIGADGDITWAQFGEDRKLPSFQVDTGELLVHRYGKRAVVRSGDVITKHLRPGKAHAVAEKSIQIRSACRRIGLGAAQVVDHDDSSVTFALLPGRSVHTLGDDALPAWQQFLELWPKWQELNVAGLPMFSALDEAETLRTWVGHAVQHEVTYSDEIEEAAEIVCDRLIRDMPEPGAPGHGLLHRDLHDKQLLWDGEALSVLDVDTAAYGEVALDIGNLTTHVRLRALQGVLSPDCAKQVLDGLEALAPQERTKVYADSAALRLACVYAFRPTAASWWKQWTLRVLDELLDEGQAQ